MQGTCKGHVADYRRPSNSARTRNCGYLWSHLSFSLRRIKTLQGRCCLAVSVSFNCPFLLAMFNRILTLAGFALLASVIHARQIPVVNGVIGGVPSDKEWSHVDLAAKPAITPAATTPGKLRVVENSGVCETTPGVYQASGYGDISSSESIWCDIL